ncbi:hypothetical protein EUTSA_v10019780mg, partial [Eutrema salsugineum]
ITYELSTQCDIQVCILYYGCDGELINTWPEDQYKRRDLSIKLHKFSHKVLEIEHSLDTRLRMFQDKLQVLLQTEPDQSRFSIFLYNHDNNFSQLVDPIMQTQNLLLF